MKNFTFYGTVAFVISVASYIMALGQTAPPLEKAICSAVYIVTLSMVMLAGQARLRQQRGLGPPKGGFPWQAFGPLQLWLYRRQSGKGAQRR